MSTARLDAVVAFHDAGVGGPLRSLERELRWLAQELEVEVLVPADGWRAQEFDELGAGIVPGPYRALAAPHSPLDLAGALGRGWQEQRWFRRRLRERSPRLAFAVTSALPAFLLAARGAEVPSMLWVGELWAQAGRGALREAAGRSLLRLEQRLAADVIACSEAVARQFPGSAKVTTIHPGIDEAAVRGRGAAFRLANEVPAEVPLIACVGNITRGRGQDVLLRSLPRLLARRPDLRCVIEGKPFPRGADHGFAAELDRLARELGLAGTVLRTAISGPIGDLYDAADVIVNPATTHPESFGRVPLEAGLVGTPSVCSAVGAIPELHVDGETALLVPPFDAGALAGAVERLLDDDQLSRRVAAGAAGLARSVADPEHSLRAFQRLVEARLGR